MAKHSRTTGCHIEPVATDRLVTCGGGDLEGGRLPPDDGIRDDLHAAHLNWVVTPLLYRHSTRSSPSERARPHNPAKRKLETPTLLEVRLLQYSTAVALEPEGRRRRRSTAAAAMRRRWRRLRCLGAITPGGRARADGLAGDATNPPPVDSSVLTRMSATCFSKRSGPCWALRFASNWAGLEIFRAANLSIFRCILGQSASKLNANVLEIS